MRHRLISQICCWITHSENQSPCSICHSAFPLVEILKYPTMQSDDAKCAPNDHVNSMAMKFYKKKIKGLNCKWYFKRFSRPLLVSAQGR